ncbi:MAG: hypothetical protein AUG79_05535 [Gemmatimonadetes bacterium 13_1_20CM_4_69_16]|nr:MAG: hypothetical protein AUG79_05535 [Gemmatimonadetes bacterium 13_1_20CM_4_69_16]
MSLAPLHPQIVHFAIALLFMGVLLRGVSLTGKVAFTGPAALVLLLVGTVGAVLAVQSGTAAHGPVERVPGARAAVMEHEEWGQRTRNIFLIVAALELVALVPRVSRWRKGMLTASGVVGLMGAVSLYEAAEHGGDLVYGYAGGVGVRSGDPADVARLLVAGLYQQAMLDRRQGKPAESAQLIAQLAQRYPDDTSIRLLAVESLIVDRQDGKAALAALKWFPLTLESRFLRFRVGLLRADAFAAAGMPDSAKATLQAMAGEFSNNRAVEDRMAKLK